MRVGGMTVGNSGTNLGLNDEALAACVGCGLCLPHCPTYRVTGDERRSPRGRIALMRAVEWDDATPDDEWHEAMDTCVGCLGCETACPSAVPYGLLIAGTRAAVAADRGVPWQLRIGLHLLSWPRLVRWGSRAAGLLQRVGLLRRSGILPSRIPLRASGARTVGDYGGAEAEVVLFTGCVMDAWQPEVHAAVIDVLTAAGITVRRSGDATGCCGALHEHAGMVDGARAHAERVLAAHSDGPSSGARSEPILVDSAGCGAALKHYGELLGTLEAQAFAERVFDVQEWCAADPRVVALIEGAAEAASADETEAADRPTVVVQDPCHLRHVQGCHTAVRDLLGPVVEVRELDDEGLCCGAGGAFQVLQPELAGAARDRKVAAVHRAARGEPGVTVASANPGCALHLAADPSLGSAGVVVRHPMEVLADGLRRAGMLGAGEGTVDDGR
ncbi:MAG: hypothetical protein CL466_10335 [Acidimicrobiaceae bacterium]|nr:hypothetical protein [Acidimicrobiaceae bacterium]